MPIVPISHTKHDLPGSVGVWRPGSTSHEESGTDLVNLLQAAEQAHGTALHGSGVALGLTVSATAGSDAVRVAAGVALDPAGRHVVLAPGGLAELSNTPDTASVLSAVTDGVDVPCSGQTGRCTVTVAWRETFDKKLLDDSFQQKFVMRHTPWLRLVDPGQPVDDQAVVLGAVDLAAGVVTAVGVSADGRAGPVPAAEGIALRGNAVGPSGAGARDAGSLRAGASGRGLRLAVADAGAPLTVGADHVGFAGADGTERVALEAGAGRLAVGPLHLSGAKGWTSLSYNAHHDDTNAAWVFPDPTRTAVTVEMDDGGGPRPRFEVWSTTPAQPTAWNLRFRVDGASGAVQVAGALTVSGGLDASRNDSDHPALSASNQTGTAVCATSDTGIALRAVGNRMAFAVFGPSSFLGAVDVTGTFSASDKQFVIDHPLDPGNRLLVHASVESDERTTIYGGIAVLGDDGTATVALPGWMEALNGDFRYQLTCLHRAAPVFVAREVGDGSFAIAGGERGMSVSWQLTGVRRDHWAQANPLNVEEDKPEAERGSYRHPEAFGEDRTRNVHHVRNADDLSRLPRLARSVLDPAWGAGPAH